MAKAISNSFIDPLISVAGLIISLLAAVLPIFTKNIISDFFILKNLATPISFLAFMIGIAIIWQITQFQQFPTISVGPSRDSGRGYRIPLINLQPVHIIWLLILLCVLLGFSFLSLNSAFDSKHPLQILGFLQAGSYLLFFSSLIGLFSILYSQTKNKYDWQEKQENFPFTIMEVLEKNGYVKPKFEILENITLQQNMLVQYDVPGIFIARKVRVRTTDNPSRTLTFIMNTDGTELIKLFREQ